MDVEGRQFGEHVGMVREWHRESSTGWHNDFALSTKRRRAAYTEEICLQAADKPPQ